jgi:hypothetical protein
MLVVTLSMRIYGLDMIFDVDNMLMKGKVQLLLWMTSRWDGRCYHVLAFPVDYTMESNVFKTYSSHMLFVNNYMKKKSQNHFCILGDYWQGGKHNESPWLCLLCWEEIYLRMKHAVQAIFPSDLDINNLSSVEIIS